MRKAGIFTCYEDKERTDIMLTKRILCKDDFRLCMPVCNRRDMAAFHAA